MGRSSCHGTSLTGCPPLPHAMQSPPPGRQPAIFRYLHAAPRSILPTPLLLFPPPATSCNTHVPLETQAECAEAGSGALGTGDPHRARPAARLKLRSRGSRPLSASPVHGFAEEPLLPPFKGTAPPAICNARARCSSAWWGPGRSPRRALGRCRWVAAFRKRGARGGSTAAAASTGAAGPSPDLRSIRPGPWPSSSPLPAAPQRRPSTSGGARRRV